MSFLKPYISEAHVAVLEKNRAYTILDGARVLMCGGFVEYWENRGELWAMVAQDCKREFVGMHKIVERFVEMVPHRRIEAVVAYDFNPGHRWMRLLGFSVEAQKLRNYWPGGGDATLYSKVRV